jgi:hypothetical protein
MVEVPGSTRAAIRDGLDYLETLGDVLSAWECDFVESLGLKIRDVSWAPSAAQLEKMNEIVARH